MMFTLSTLLLAETVLAQDVPVLPPPAQARILREDNLAKELSGAIARANLEELKMLSTDQSMTKLKDFVKDQLLNKKLDMMEEGLEEKLEGALSATTAAPGLSMEDEEKLMAGQIIDQSVDPNVTDPKLVAMEKALEHKISDTVIDCMAELKIKAEAGEEVSDEEQTQILGQHIIANVLAMFENEPEEKKADLEKALREAYEKLLGKGKRRSLQFDWATLFQQAAPFLQQATPLVQQISAPLLQQAPPAVQQAAQVAFQLASNPNVQNIIQTALPPAGR